MKAKDYPICSARPEAWRRRRVAEALHRNVAEESEPRLPGPFLYSLVPGSVLEHLLTMAVHFLSRSFAVLMASLSKSTATLSSWHRSRSDRRSRHPSMPKKER